KNAVRRGQAAAAASGLVSSLGGHVMHAYDASTVSGFSIATDERSARRLAANSSVDFVQPVYRYRASADTSGTQANPPSWGLDRIDQPYQSLGGTLDHSYSYPNTAPDVNVFVVDTGIAVGDPDFGTRATTYFDAIGGTTTNACFAH